MGEVIARGAEGEQGVVEEDRKRTDKVWRYDGQVRE